MPDRYNAFLLFGPPGVGKGTQGKILGCVPGMRHLATGDMFRAMDKQSELGKQIRGYMLRGELVPDELTVQLWQQYVQQLVIDKVFRPAADVLVLDGIPRSVNQAQAIAPHLHVMKVVYLACPDIDQMVRRMKGRAHKENRPDDADETVIRRRFEVYEAETRPVLSFYDRAQIVEVNALGAPLDVLMRILQAIVPVYSTTCGNPLA
jgi:adenylate kinase